MSAQRNETETKQFQNYFNTVSILFRSSFISLCGQFRVVNSRRQCVQTAARGTVHTCRNTRSWFRFALSSYKFFVCFFTSSMVIKICAMTSTTETTDHRTYSHILCSNIRIPPTWQHGTASPRGLRHNGASATTPHLLINAGARNMYRPAANDARYVSTPTRMHCMSPSTL